MMRTLSLLALAVGASANHLAGPMQDRSEWFRGSECRHSANPPPLLTRRCPAVDACMAQECPEFSDFNNAPGFNGLSVSFAQFVAPFSERSTALALMTPPLLLTRRCPTVNFNKFGFDMTYVTKVMGYGKQNAPAARSAGPPSC